MNSAALSGRAWPEGSRCLCHRVWLLPLRGTEDTQTAAGSGAGTLGWREGDAKVPSKAFLTGWRGIGGHSSHARKLPAEARAPVRREWRGLQPRPMRCSGGFFPSGWRWDGLSHSLTEKISHVNHSRCGFDFVKGSVYTGTLRELQRGPSGSVRSF